MAGILFSIACVVFGYLIEYLLAPIGPMVLDYMLGPLRSVISYVYYYKANMRELREEVEKLMLAGERVQHMVDDARRNGEEIESDVRKWLQSVQETIEEARRFLDAEDDAHGRFFCGLCPNFKARYQLSKRATELAKVANELQEEGRFDRVSFSVAPKWKGIAPVKGYEAFESRMATSKKIMAAFRNESVSIIGVYGMGGVGKSTLLKEVGRQALEDKLFDDVVMATVTQNPSLKKIQGEIADKLGLRFDEETVAGRAGHLRERLKKEKKILVILDDVWSRIDLETVGIPYGNAHKGCKILLASRSVDVLSTEMDAQKCFAVGVLSDQEAWELFKKMAGKSVEDLDLQSTATEIAKECAGLPVAIVTVARALRNKNSFEWKNALRQLRRPTARNIRKMQSVIYSTLELSYRQLESEELKSTFLLCGLMNYNASVHDLLKYGMGLGLFQGVYTAEEARDRVQTLVRNLKASCLLIDGNTSDSFRMHDVVRDVASSIAFRDNHVLVARDEDETVEWQDEAALEKCTAISLQCSDIQELPDRLNAPQLKFFNMACKNTSLKIPDNFFKGAGMLRVLHLTSLQFPSLPSSLNFLDKLRTLCLDQCMLGDTAVIGELRRLIILSFNGSDIQQLPKEVRQLTRLKILDLSNCTQLKVIPPNVISSLLKLEELYMENSFSQWEVAKSISRKGNASIGELENLPHLVSLDILIPDAVVWPEELLLENLTRYRIFIGDIWDWSGGYETSRTLKLKLDSSTHLDDGVMGLLKKAEDLYLDGLKGVRNLYELDSEGFPGLKHLHILNSADIQYLIDSAERVSCNAFSLLESLFLQNLISLEKICHGQLSTEFLHNLKNMKVENCDRLKSLFSFSMVRGLLQLEEIKITECEIMEEIVTQEDADDVDNTEATATINFFNLRSLELKCLPKLMSFCSKTKKVSIPVTDSGFEEIIFESGLDNPTALFSEEIAFPNLEVLKVSSIGSPRIWHDHHLASSNPQVISSFQNLTFLLVKGCHNLTHLLSSSTSASLVKLKRLEVHRCNLIQEVFLLLGEEQLDTLLFPQLEFLSLKDLPELTRFCWANSVAFPSLNKLYIKHCPKLKEFIFTPTSTDISVNVEGEVYIEENVNAPVQPLFNEKVTLPALKVMKVSHLHSIKLLWHDRLTDNSFCKLKNLKVKHCKKLQSIFPGCTLRRARSLESLIVIDCDSLEEVFQVKDQNVDGNQDVEAARLRSLYLSRLPKLKHVWSKDPVGIFTYRSIQSVNASNCLRLKSIFPFSVARSLPQLKELQLDTCALEEIVAKGQGSKAAARFVFSHLTTLRLQNLPELRRFYPGKYTSDWPLLKKLEVTGCNKAEILASDIQIFKETQGGGQSEIPFGQPLFFVKEDAFLNLEELRLEENGIMKKIWHGELLSAFFQKTSSKLKELKLSKLPELTCLWKEDTHQTLAFQNLETLLLSACDNLTSLVPSSVSFEHLSNLEVSNCDGLVKLIMLTTANSMVQLTRMSILDCKMLTEVVAGDDNEAEDEVVFSHLKHLELNSLPSLAYFFSGNQALSFPSLETLTVWDCPELLTFCKGAYSAPKLGSPHASKRNWQGDAEPNTTVRAAADEHELGM